jgi:membrane-associated protease RseP (regulator of RpoE activity)
VTAETNSPIQPSFTQDEYEKITSLVTSEFQVEEALLQYNIPTYYLKQPQETKQPFLRLLKNLKNMNLIAFLRKENGKIVLKVVPKHPVKPSNTIVNWLLLLATIATTFLSGYLVSPNAVNPYVGGASFTIAMLAVLGTHEMGHKITANKNEIEATLPYFIPGPPPLGTLGAVIMQKSLPPNRDALFDIGANGPILGFIITTIVSMVGLTMLVPSEPVPAGIIGTPLLWILIEYGLQSLRMIPQPPPNGMLLLHPFAFAGWVGIVVTMLNLLPAGMLDGGHVTRALTGEKFRLVLGTLSVFYLFILRVYVMAILVLFMVMYRHPGPLDDVSKLSTRRKLMAIGLIAIFILCTPPSLHLF